MARTTTKTAVVAEVVADLPGLPAAVDAANQLAALHEQDAQNVKALAAQLNYPGPTDPDSLERACNIEIAYHAQSTFRLGATLMLLRESCLHGDFLARLDRIGITKSTAYRYISIAARFKDEGVREALQGFGVGKIIELAALDDSEIQELIDGKSARGLTVDKIETLSLKELRVRLGEAEKDAQAKDAYIKRLSDKVASLEVKQGKKVVADTDWPDALEPVSDQVAAAGRKIAQAISELETCRITLFEVAQDIPEEQRPKYEAALAHIAEVYEQALSRAEAGLTKERTTFDKSLGAYAPEAA